VTNLDVYNWCRAQPYFQKWTDEQLASYILQKMYEDRILILDWNNTIFAFITFELNYDDKEIYVEHFVSRATNSMQCLLNFGLPKYDIKMNDGWTIVAQRTKYDKRPLKFKLTTQTFNKLSLYGRRQSTSSN